MLFKKLLIGASIAASVSAIASTPAFAGSLTNATITGNDYIKYDVQGKQTYNNPNASLSTILTGDKNSPTGNVELFASSETAYKNLNEFKNVSATTLSGTVGGKNISLSSLNGADWFTTKTGQYTTAFGADNLANRWLKDFATSAKQTYSSILYNTFLGIGGFQASSDPNISYVNQNDITGDINIGLAGHYDLKAYYQTNPQYGLFASVLPNGFQASEVVKYTYNGVTDFLYSFNATNSGLTEKIDGKSHSGNYQVSIKGVPPVASVPEPSVMLGLVGVFALFVTQRQLKKVQS